MKKFTLLFCVATFAASSFFNQDVNAQQTGVWTKTITWGTGTRKEQFNVPASYNASKKYKLIVGLHGLQGDPVNYMTFFGPMTSGATENSNNVCNSKVYNCASPVYGNFIIVCPQATGTNTDFWQPVSDTALITKAITDAMSMYNIDPEYIYLNGLSLGGRAALRYGLLNYKRFRGLQLWCPAIQSMSEANNLAAFNFSYQNAKYIPIAIMVAMQDGQLPQQTQTYRQIYNAGGQVMLQTMYNYCHAPSPDPYTFNAIDFIDKHATSFKNNDASIYAVNSPLQNICSGTFTPKVVIQNKGIGTVTSAIINYQIDGGTVNTMNWTGSLGQLVRANVTLPAQTVASGAHTIKVYTTMPNGVADAVPANDDITINFNAISNGASASLNEGFESQKQAVSGIFQTDWRTPSGWRTTGTDSSFSWELDTVDGGAYGTSAVCILANNASLYPGMPAPFNAVKKYSLISPDYDFSNATAPVLTYDYAYAPILSGSTLQTDTLAIKYSDDCGATWKYLLRKGGVALNTSGTTAWGSKTTGTFFAPTSTQWKTETVSLSALTGKAEVLIALENISGNGNLMYLDNIKLTGATGIAGEQDSNAGMQIYPNPSNGNFALELNSDKANVEIFSLLGEKVFSSLVNSRKSEFTLSGISNGVYIIKVNTEEGISERKIIIQK
jgi:predicted esterase